MLQEIHSKYGITISNSAYNNYENFKTPRMPRNDILEIIAKFYNCDMEYFLNDSLINKTNRNIKINELLGLSDEAIHFIEHIKADNNTPYTIYGNTLNELLESNYYIKDILFNIYRIHTYKKQLEIMKRISQPLTDGKKKLKKADIIKITTELNNNLILQDSNYINSFYILEKEAKNSTSKTIQKDISFLYNDLQNSIQKEIELKNWEVNKAFSKYIDEVVMKGDENNVN